MTSVLHPLIGQRLYRIREQVLHTQLEEEAVLLDLESGRYFSLNSVGGRIWAQLVERPRTSEELLTDLTEQYDVSREKAEPDLLALLEDLVTQKLLEVTDR
ncbi:MAG: PqqD family protein [Methylacidiphilaceae bacterium]|nr:PqqD family protein [Candidatus Methylacidiphilaceae bacterium]